MNPRFPSILPILPVLLLLFCCGPVFAQTLRPVIPALPDGLHTDEFFSPAVGRVMKYDIVLPPDYETGEGRYPVLYLLHGLRQNYTVWGRSLNAAWYARELGDLILVLPDGGNSWFVNWFASHDGQPQAWEDHIIEDLITHVDTNYRTQARREGRAIAGLSMGGFAALSLGLRHPHLFISLGSSSGALSHARSAAAALEAGLERMPPRLTPEQQAQIADAERLVAEQIAIPGFSTQAQRTPDGVEFGSADRALQYDPFTIIYEVPRSQMPHIYLDAGTEDGLVREARELASLLMINNVPFDYAQSRGGHNAEYWRQSIGRMMSVQNEVMHRALGNRP